MSVYVDSEWGTLTDVLMCPTDRRFGSPRLVRDSELVEMAQRQHSVLITVLRNLGVACHLLSLDNDLAYKCYVRDSVVPTPWGALVPRMGFHQRDSEPGQVLESARLPESAVWRRVTCGSLEGGDVSILRHGVVAIGCNGFRTSVAGARQSMQWFIDNGWECRMFRYPRRFMHLDIILGVIDESNLVCCTSALSPSDLDWLKAAGMSVHAVSEPESRAMACNVLSVDGRHVITCDRNSRSANMLRDLGFVVTEVNLDAFVADGGGVHCLVQPIRRMPTRRILRSRTI